MYYRSLWKFARRNYLYGFVLFRIATFTVFSITTQTWVHIFIKVSIIISLPERFFLKCHLIFIHIHANDIAASDLSKNHMKKPILLPLKLLFKWFSHQINAEFPHEWELGTAESGPIVFFPLCRDSTWDEKGLKKQRRMAPCQWLGSRYAIGAWAFWQSCWTGERSLEQVQQVGRRGGQRANGSPGGKLSWEQWCFARTFESVLVMKWEQHERFLLLFKVKLFAHTMNQPDHSNL